jgi:ribosomal protein L37AE/L43A
MMENHKEYLSKRIGVVSALKSNTRALNEFRKIYNDVCKNCKIKLVKNPRMDIEGYCEKCQEIVAKRMKRVKKLMGVK